MADKSAMIIAEAARSIADSARSMESFASMLESSITEQNAIFSTLSDKLDKIGGSNDKGKSAGTNPLAGSLGAFGAKDIEKAADNMKNLGGVMPGFSEGVKDFAKAMRYYSKVPTGAAEQFAEDIVGLGNKFADLKYDEIQKGGDALQAIAKGIALFGLALAASAVIFLLAAPASLIIIPLIALYGYTFAQIGKLEGDIEKGAKGLAWAGLGLISLALGIASFGLFNVTPKDILMSALAVVVVGGAFGLIGIFEEYIEQGALALAYGGLSLIVLALGLGSFRLFGIGPEDYLNAGAAIIAVGGAMALAGLLSVPIALGALAIAAASFALIILSAGLFILDKVYKKAMDGLLAPSYFDDGKTNLEVLIQGVADAFFINPVKSAFMLLGAVAISVASIAMVVLSAGLWALNGAGNSPLMNIEQKAYGDRGGETTRLDNVISSVVEAFYINPVKSAFMIIGAAALMVASISMIVLSAGIWALGKAALGSGLFELETKAYGDRDGMTSKIDNVITSITEAFYINPVKSAFMLLGSAALIVASVSMLILSLGIITMSKAIKKAEDAKMFAMSSDGKGSNFEYMMESIVNGFAIGPLDLISLYASVPAWLMTGAALLEIGEGLVRFTKVIEKNIDPSKVSQMLTSVLTPVIEAFTAVGPGGDAIDWDSVEDGIDAVSDVGNLMAGIADGVAKMAELKIPQYDKGGKIIGYITLGNKEFSKVSDNIKMIITAVAGTLTEIGQSAGETGWFSKSAGEKGADAIRGIGGDLKGIADFVEMAADLRMPKYDENGKIIDGQTVEITPDMLGRNGKVYNNIKLMIEAISGVLGDVGSGAAAQSGWFNDSDIEKGKQAIMGIGKDINDIAQSVLAMSQIKDYQASKKMLRDIIKTVPDILTEVAPIIEKNKDSIAKSLRLLNDVNEPLSSFIETINKADAKTKTGGSSVSIAIKDIISAVTNVPADANVSGMEKINAVIGQLSNHVDPIERLSKSLFKVADGIGKMGSVIKKFDKDALTKYKVLVDSLVVFAKVDPNALNATSDRGKQLLAYIHEAPAPKIEIPATPVTPAPKSSTGQAGTKDVTSNTSSNKKTEVVQQKMDMTELNEALTGVSKELANIKNILQGTIKTEVVNS